VRTRAKPEDQAERDRAVVSKANLAVTAGAGTGKTHLLVEKILHKALVEKIPLERILALTFTEKAANEMLIRLRSELQKRAVAWSEDERKDALERAELGTIHSFCAHVLRQFPIEAGVAPDFEVDEGAVFRRRFEEAWPRWLDREIGPGARRPRVWQDLLKKVGLEELRALAEGLSEFGVPEGRVSGAAMLREFTEEAARQVPKLAPALRGEKAPQKSIQGPEKQAALKLAQDVQRIDEALVEKALTLAGDFAREFRRDFLRAGWISFDGILGLVHDLLRSEAFPGVREILRSRFDLVLVDEFQDTDPLQGEIIRMLCEDAEGRLVPGKLFLVGDPKQSIYSFRGADIIAYQGLVERMMAQGGEQVVLSTNFRSHGKLLEFVNAAFSRLIAENGRLQPRYDPIRPATDAEERFGAAPIQGIRVTGADAEGSRETEAQELARWIRRRPDGVEYKHVAVLLRSLVDVDVYLDALRSAGIPYVVEGEKYFYGTQEVLDFVNLLRAVANPHDRVAVTGVLRSPYGAVPDAEIFERRKSLDYRRDSTWPIFGLLRSWNEAAGRLGVGALLDRLLTEGHALEIAQAGYHGEQAVANLLKLRAKAGELEAKGGCTLREFLDVARQAVRELEEEGESPLADETLDAVKVLSIHRSKGLEFPVVVLPDLHRLKAAPRRRVVSFDWTTRVLGVRLGEVINAGSAALEHLRREREREEWRRLLYVACTRAEQLLVLMGSDEAKEESFLGLLEADLEGRAELRKVPYARPAFVPAAPSGAPPKADWASYVAAWKAREAASRPPERLTSPTKLEQYDKAKAWELDDGPRRASRGVETGIRCHEILERMDFAKPAVPEDADEEVGSILKGFFRSAAFREIAGSEILARELPFLLPREGRVVQGVVDLVYRRRGKLVVADYKTDTIVKPEAYATVRAITVEALRRALGETPAFRLIYLRHGKVVEI
jgi:ATP-dependent helicase/nuclease subunit A